MTSDGGEERLRALEALLPALRQQRTRNAFANDVFESVAYWCNLGERLLKGDTKVNYLERATEERKLLAKLLERALSRPASEQRDYSEVLTTAGGILDQIADAVPLEEGHLGFLTTAKRAFGFLETEYGFRIGDEQPIAIRYSSSLVYVCFECSGDLSQACTFGPEGLPDPQFWLADLLFLYEDNRYRQLPEGGLLQTRAEVVQWLTFIAGLWKQYGREVLTCHSGIFDRLAEAQTKRDAEYVAFMDGQKGK